MPSGALLFGFVAAALVVLLIPGPGVLYVVAQSVGQGHRAGLASALGLSAGALVHVAAATAGLSAILLTSATAFGIVKVLGAGYLIYLGIRTLFAGRPTVSTEASTPLSLYRVPESYAVASCIRSVGAGLGYQEPWWRSAPCCGAVRVIVFVEDPVVIEKVLTHLNETAT